MCENCIPRKMEVQKVNWGEKQREDLTDLSKRLQDGNIETDVVHTGTIARSRPSGKYPDRASSSGCPFAKWCVSIQCSS
jgi:hypothetical protein